MYVSRMFTSLLLNPQKNKLKSFKCKEMLVFLSLNST